MQDEDIFKNSPTVALIHNISKNQIKCLSQQIVDYDLGREIRFIMMIYDNQGCSQDDLVNLYGESKANIAKSLKKLEDKGYIKRDINPDNRRKYMLKTTPKADELVPRVRQMSKDWESKVGLDGYGEEFREKLRSIAINGMKLIG